jgi:Domain of unknown function (DUF4136)
MKRLAKMGLACLTLLMSGCYPEGPEYVEELDIVYTNYDASFDFQEVSTFALPDKVIKLDGSEFQNNNGEEIPDFISDTYGLPILNAIRHNMEDLGWTEVEKDADPDVLFLPTVTRDTYIYYYYDSYYWNWWYPTWNSGWGWYYSGYYYPTYRGGYTSGTLFIQMTDTENSTQGNINVVWSSEINGLVQGNTASIIQRINTTIDQAFVQSPYLKLHQQ